MPSTSLIASCTSTINHQPSTEDCIVPMDLLQVVYYQLIEFGQSGDQNLFQAAKARQF